METDDRLKNTIRMEEIAKHAQEDDAWLVIGNRRTFPDTGPRVYDITSYLNDHPGGAEVLLEYAGKNADEMFEDIGHSKQARKNLDKYLLGVLEVSEEEERAAALEANKTANNTRTHILACVLIVAAAGVVYTALY